MHALPRHFARLLRVALWVAATDLATKTLAVLLLATRSPRIAPAFRLTLVYNSGAAFGISVGQYTWHLSLALTVLAMLLTIPVSRDLSRVDDAAPIALGLIVGGAMGNLVNMLASTTGVVDFLAVRQGVSGEIVFNVADVAAYIGLVMLARTSWVIVRAIRAERRGQVHVAEARTGVAREVEVPRAVYVDGVRVRQVPTGTLVHITADGRVERPGNDPVDVPMSVVRTPSADGRPPRSPGRRRGAGDFPRPASIDPPLPDNR